jgi:hypothetical protein
MCGMWKGIGDMTYFIDAWYVENKDGTLEPVANLATARHLLSIGEVVRIVHGSRLELV